MISYDTFAQYLMSGEITSLHFRYGVKEYVIVREEGEEAPTFVFVSEDQEPIRYPSVKSLLKYAFFEGHSLREIWYHISPICSDSLLDNDYILALYGDTFGKVMCSSSGTAVTYDRYLTERFLPALVLSALMIAALLLATLFIDALTWTFFGVTAAIIVGGLIIAEVIFYSNTKRYRYGNPLAHMYLLDHGVVIVTTRFEHAIPYHKIIRLETEAGISIVTMKTVFTFVGNDGEEVTKTLNAIMKELKENKHLRKKAH